MKILAGTLAYLLVTFPLAYCWHLIFFEQTYQDLGYISRQEPIIAFGFLAILMQGVILSFLFPKLCRGLSYGKSVLLFTAVMGGYHWTAHVLAEAAKHPIAPLPKWFVLETLYLLIQFLLGSLLLGWVYQTPASTVEETL